jgi:broad specificity phosphatase PhoE
MAEFFLVRHAQASFASDNYDTLSSLGVDQARILGRYFAEQAIEFDAVLSGNMRRHLQTVDAVVAEMPAGEQTCRDNHYGLDEYPFRDMLRIYCDQHPEDELVRATREQSADRQHFFRLLRQVLDAWSEDRLEGAPEPWDSFVARVLDARAHIQTIAADSERILAVSSGGAISMFTGSVLGLSPAHVFDLNMQLRNTSITRFFTGSHGFRLAEFNAVPHFAQRRFIDRITFS